MFNDPLPRVTEKEVIARADEALGLLSLLKPLFRKSGKLTVAEQSVLIDTLCEALNVLQEAQTSVWNAKMAASTPEPPAPPKANGTAVRKAGGH